MDRYHGILCVDKPLNWTSHDVVARVRRILGQRSVGHAGTLDPLATGVLLLCAGQATRVSEYLMAGDKLYRAAIRLGASTDTYDAGGQVTAERPVPGLSAADLSGALAAFLGPLQQVPPAYSAIKQDGVALHRRARRGEEVELRPRPVIIHSIHLLEWRSPDLTVDVACSPGTYIRSLAHDLGRRLGCGAHLAALQRRGSGHFRLEDAVSLETLVAAAAADDVDRYLRPVEAALTALVPVPVDEAAVLRLAHGQPIPGPATAPGPGAYARKANGEVAAILVLRDGLWWPTKVFAANHDQVDEQTNQRAGKPAAKSSD